MSKIKQYALGALVLAIAVPAYMGIKHKLAEPAGVACTSSTKCRGNNILTTGMCFEDASASAAYCTHTCSSASDCGGGLACEEVEGTWTTETSKGGNHATQIRTSQGTRNVCVRAEPQASAE